jgi:hypothetical protein
MLSSVYLDHQAGFEADEIDDVSPNRVLASKL